MESLESFLERQEAKRYRPYMDCCSKPYKECCCERKGFLSVGIGRNMDAVPFSEDEIALMAKNDRERVFAGLDRSIPWWRGLTQERQAVLVSVAYNCGVGGLMKFQKMLHALAHGDYRTAKAELLDSAAARQLPERYSELAGMLFDGREL